MTIPNIGVLAAYGARTHTASCTITRPDPEAPEPELDPETGLYPDPEPITVLEDHPCSVLPTGGDRVQQFGEGPTVLRSYDVILTDHAADIHVGDTITIASDADHRLDGMRLTVLDVVSSALPVNRRLVAEEVLR